MADKGMTGELLRTRGMAIEWKICGFLSLSTEHGDFYKSPVFDFEDSRWYIKVHPNGYRVVGWISVFLTKDNSGPPKRVNYTFEISNEKWSRSDTFKDDDNSKGRKRFFKRIDLMEIKSISNSGILIIRCYLKNADSKRIPVRSQPMKLTELDTLSGDLGNLLSRGSNFDVTLNVQNKEFRAHRLILEARSEVFAAMFEHELSESKTGVVDIVDCDPDTFEDFLRYLYTGKLEGVTQDKVIHLYRTADKYAVLKLKSFCVEFILRNLSAENVCAVAILAQQHSEDELLASAQTIFNKNVAKVFSMDAWEELLRKDYLLANRMLKKMASVMKIHE